MSKTGMNVTVTNTVLGAAPQVNANSMLIVAGATATTSGTIAFSLGVPYMLRSALDLKNLGIDVTNNAEIVRQVEGFYNPVQNVDNSGTILWLVGVADNAAIALDSFSVIKNAVRQTVVNGFQYRPRNILVSAIEATVVDTPDPLVTYVAPVDKQGLQAMITALYTDGFSTVVIVGSGVEKPVTGAVAPPDLSLVNAPMVGTLIVTDVQAQRACVGKLGGFMSTLSVGTSIGDGTFPSFADTMYFTDINVGGTAFENTPCAKIEKTVADALGTNQYIFTRTRPPLNGLWFNDGATAVADDTALSTLEAGRTIASMVDDLRKFFTPYLNNKIPVNNAGDIQPTYKQVVLDNANESVIKPYIDSGDISNARINIVAKNNYMVGTRTWEVTLGVLPAPTLRWIDAFVFYVSSLS